MNKLQLWQATTFLALGALGQTWIQAGTTPAQAAPAPITKAAKAVAPVAPKKERKFRCLRWVTKLEAPGVHASGGEPIGVSLHRLGRLAPFSKWLPTESQVLVRTCVRLVVDDREKRLADREKKQAAILAEVKSRRAKERAVLKREESRLKAVEKSGRVDLGSFENIGRNETVVRQWAGRVVRVEPMDGEPYLARIVGISDTALSLKSVTKRLRVEMLDIKRLTVLPRGTKL